MKGSPSSLPLPLFSFLFLWTISFLGHPEGVARRMEYFVDGLNRRNGSSAGVNGNPRDRAKDYLEGGGRQRLGKS